MRPSTLVTVCALGLLLLLWAPSTGRAQDTQSSEDSEDTSEEAAAAAQDEEVEEEKVKKEKTTEIEEERDVLELHVVNFDRALSENKYLLVEFYAPWCGHCKSLAPVYEEAASRLKEEEQDIRLAKVDAIEEKELTEEFDVRGYPDLKLFINGDRKQPKDYGGERSAEGIIQWMKRQASAGAPRLDSPDSAAHFIQAHNITVVGFFKDADSEAAKVLDELYFDTTLNLAKTFSPDVFNKYEVHTDAVVLFKKFDEGRADLPLTEDKLDRQSLNSFIQESSLELITKFTPEKTPAIFNSKVKTHNLMFINSSVEAHEALVEETRSVAKEFKGKILFILLDINDTPAKILEFFSVSADEAPTVRLFSMESRKKFTLSPSPFTADTLRKLCQDVLDGTAQPYYMSEEVPDDWDKGAVKVLVGKSFNSVALDPTKNVFVKFYAPWCDFCKKLAPVWQELGEKYANHTDIIIAKIDASINEVEDQEVRGFPTLKYFPAEGKEAVVYSGDQTLEKMSEFLDNGGVLPEEPEEDDDEDEDVDEDDEEGEEGQEEATLEETVAQSEPSTNATSRDEL